MSLFFFLTLLYRAGGRSVGVEVSDSLAVEIAVEDELSSALTISDELATEVLVEDGVS